MESLVYDPVDAMFTLLLPGSDLQPHAAMTERLLAQGWQLRA